MIKIDPEKCIGCGLCESLCANVFKLNSETGKSELINQEIKDCDIKNVIESCPTAAISQE